MGRSPGKKGRSTKKKAAGRKSSAKNGKKNGGNGNGSDSPKHLEARLRKLEKELPELIGLARGGAHLSENHRKAYERLNLYIQERRTSYSTGDTAVLGPDNFSDETDYVPMAKAIAKAYRDLDKAGEAAKEAKKETTGYKRENTALNKKYNAAEAAVVKAESAKEKAEGKVEKLAEKVKEAGAQWKKKAEAEKRKSAQLKWTRDRVAALNTTHYHLLDDAAKGKEGAYERLVNFTLNPKLYGEDGRTPVTDWVEQEALPRETRLENLITRTKEATAELKQVLPNYTK